MKPVVLIGLFCLLLLFPVGCAQNGTTSDATPMMSQTPTREVAASDATILRQTSTLSAASKEITQEEGSGNVMGNNMHLETSSTIRDVVDHPAFQGFGQFILPLDRGSYDKDMPLENVASLLPYHSNVYPDAVVNAINYMIDEVGSGETIF